MQTLSLSARYQPEVHALYDRLRAPSTMLLESAEVADKSGKQSLIGLDCALRISVRGRTVTLTPHNANGMFLCHGVQQSLPLAEKTDDKGQTVFVINFPRPPAGDDEITRLKAPGPFDVLRAVRTQLQDFPQLLMAGLISFDFIRSFEDFEPLPDEDQGEDLIFYVFDLSIRVDHINKKLTVDMFACNDDICSSLALKAVRVKNLIDKEQFDLPLPDVPARPEFTVHPDDKEFAGIVSSLKEHIVAGDIFQVVPARIFSMRCSNPYRAYCHLKTDNPSPYAYYFNDPDFVLFGASPEFALRFEADTRKVAISPIAGTRPRGTDEYGNFDEDLDERLETELRTDKKETAEHLMLVDLARNDLARIAVPGTRKVSNMLHVDRYQSVMHLVSDVTAVLRDDLDAFHAYLAAMNMGTLSGAPKLKAHELIYKYEGKKRGCYGGVAAILSADGSFDSCIVIRSAVVKNGMAQVQAGCGVVYDSDEQAECMETLNKARSVLKAIAKSEVR